MLTNRLLFTCLAGKTRREYFVVSCDDIVLITTDEGFFFQNQLIQQFIFVHRHFPLKIDNLKYVPPDQGYSIATGNNITNGYLLPGKNDFVKDWPFTDAIFVELSAIDIELVDLLVVVDHVALAILDG